MQLYVPRVFAGVKNKDREVVAAHRSKVEEVPLYGSICVGGLGGVSRENDGEASSASKSERPDELWEVQGRCEESRGARDEVREDELESGVVGFGQDIQSFSQPTKFL
ncbi:hypothetical protein E2C01_032565 [Portunus trituberculatus]|uniref:Uncharacterized protein n=1 Tax=Portunus trituberculatus TaxID=210409 RepID=A0A5B7F123_PORTR|nr:hypothetical protein [Portunus trituberculatus]